MNRFKLNYLIDTGLLISGAVVIITGILKLYSERSLREIHDISGVLFTFLILAHIVLHFDWIINATNNFRK
ncbi:MAG: DUF4405 domain-containing protein [Nanoarchaeota archaeon]|nr:DUF4405 domain-containing protein [Nanoarchaeota archaeon]MBU4451228.1 DUF4405 domain-containing protein [Nanoarchaeota archaeon]